MINRWGVLAVVILVGLSGRASAQEGTGAPVLRLRADEIQSIYPATAKAKGLKGEAVVTCQTAQETVWACALISETPGGEGFGAAALALVERYAVAAPTDQDRRSGYAELFTIVFAPPEVKSLRVRGVDYQLPEQIEGPSLNALYDAWPRAARFSGIEGSADLRCTVTLQGRLQACTIANEQALGQGSGDAALKVAPLFRFAPARKAGKPAAMSIPITVAFQCDTRCRRFEEAVGPPPQWLSTPTPAEVRAAYPPAALARALEGYARLDCAVTRAGGLADCRIVAQSAPGEDFGTAALGLTDRFRLSSRNWDSREAFSVAFDGRAGKVKRAWEVFPAPPPVSQNSVVQARASARCRVASAGKLEACDLIETVSTDPEVARQTLANLGRVSVDQWTEEGRSTVGSTVEVTVSTGPRASPSITLIPISVALPGSAPNVINYRPMTRLGVKGDVGRFYPQRALMTETTGKVVLACAGLKDGQPEGCEVATETPPDYQFGEAAMMMSSHLRYSPESIDGLQADGVVMIPIVFSVPR
jgi:TonB family protein